MSTSATELPQSTPTTQIMLSPIPPRNTPSIFGGSNVSINNYHDTSPLSDGEIKRSGSPTPSEAQELRQLDGTLKRVFRKESWKDRGFLTSLAMLIFVLGIIISIAVFQDTIITALTPASEWIRDQPAGFLIPLAFLIVLSVPPLFGAEIVNVLCGLIYGLGIGLALVLVGSIIGESITYFALRYWFRAKAEKMEKGEDGALRWPSLARVIREGGFKIAVVVKYCAIPSHITTALFSVCGINYWVFLSSMVLAFPKAVLTTWIGAQGHSKQDTGEDSTVETVISVVIFLFTITVTVVAARWINRRQKAAALIIIRERRTAIDLESHSNSPPSYSTPSPSPLINKTGSSTSRLPALFPTLPYVEAHV